MNEIINLVVYSLLILSTVIGIVRFIKGPDTLNRIIAFDLISICIVGIVVVFSDQEATSHYIEMILIFCLLGFASTLALMESLYRSYYKEKNK